MILSNKSLGTDLVITTAGLLLSAVFSLITQGLAARTLGANGFGEYSTLVRIANVLLPVVMLGMSLAVTRYLGMHRTSSNALRARYALVTASIVCVAFGLLCIALVAAPLSWIEWLLGASARLRYMILWLLMGMIAYTYMYAFYRGAFHMLLATALAITNALAYLAIFLLMPSSDLQTIVRSISLAVTGVALIFLLLNFAVKRREPGPASSASDKLPSFAEITSQVLQYGIPRVPGFLIHGLLYSAGTFLLARAGDMAGTASLNAGIHLLSVANLITGPIGIVLLPRGADLVGQGKISELAVLSKDLWFCSIHLGLFMLFQWIALGMFVLEVWLQFDTLPLIVPAMIVCLSLPFFSIYNVLRNILDSLTARPLNLINQLMGLAAFAISATILGFIRLDIALIAAISTTASLIAIGVATSYRLVRELNIRITADDMTVTFKVLVAACLSSIVSWCALAVGGSLSIPLKITMVTVFLAMSIITFLVMLYIWRVRWLTRIANHGVIQQFLHRFPIRFPENLVK